MLSTDRDALLCDMAETYNVYDLKALPVDTLAALAFGLSPESRINRKLLKHKHMTTEMLLALVADRLAAMSYQLFGKEGDTPPTLLYDALYGSEQEPDIFGYASGEEFLSAWKQKAEDTHG